MLVADSSATSANRRLPPSARPPRRRQHRAGICLAGEGVQQHRARIPGGEHALGDPRPGRRPQPGRRLTRSRRAPAVPRRGPAGARCARQSRPGIAAAGPGSGPADPGSARRLWLRGKFLLPREPRARPRRRAARPRGPGGGRPWCAPPPAAGRSPRPTAPARARRRVSSQSARPACRQARPRIADQRRRPLPQRRVVQGGDIAFGQPQHRRDPPAGEPQLPQRRKSHVAHHRVRRVVAEQRSAAPA